MSISMHSVDQNETSLGMKLQFRLWIFMHIQWLTHNTQSWVAGLYSEVAIRDSRVTDRIIKTTHYLSPHLTPHSASPVCVSCVLMHFIPITQLRWYPYPSICLEMFISQRLWYINLFPPTSATITTHSSSTQTPAVLRYSRCCCTSLLKKCISIGILLHLHHSIIAARHPWCRAHHCNNDLISSLQPPCTQLSPIKSRAESVLLFCF